MRAPCARLCQGCENGARRGRNSDLCAVYAFTTQVDYAGYEKVMHELAKYGVVCDGTEFAAEVTLKLRAKEENFARFKSFLADYTSGRSICTVIGSAFGKED